MQPSFDLLLPSTFKVVQHRKNPDTCREISDVTVIIPTVEAKLSSMGIHKMLGYYPVWNSLSVQMREFFEEEKRYAQSCGKSVQGTNHTTSHFVL
jgi:hypothetical protein